MGSGIPLDDAAIMSTALEALLYGFSLLMFIGTVWVLIHEEGHKVSNMTRISIAVTLLVLSTIHLIVDIVRLDEGLVKHRFSGPQAFFADVTQNTFVIKNAVYTLQTLLGDGVVIFRCYVAWQSVWIVVFPAMLWCGVAVAGIGSVYSVSQATSNASNIFAKQTGEWITAFWALTLTTNLLSSGLLAYRIWSIERNVAPIRASKSTMMPVLRALVDSAALYSATLFSALLCFTNSSNGQFVVLDMVMPIISIAFYMVLIRIAIRRKNLQFTSTMRSTTRSTSRPAPLESQVTAYGMRPVLQVHITHDLRSDSVPPYPPGQDIDWDDPSMGSMLKGDESNRAAYRV